jgi:tetratricopeptide (TPR) repeat protein
VDTGPRTHRRWRGIAAGVAIAVGVVLLLGVPLQLDRRLVRPSLPGAWGLLLYLATDYADAARAYREDLRRSARGGEEAGADPAETALLTGDLAGAASASQAALAADPARVPARLTLAEIALQRGDPRGALAALEPLTGGRQEYFEALLLAAVARARLGEPDPAIDLLNRALRGYEEERPTSFLQALEVTGELARLPAASRPACLLAHFHRYLRIFDPSHGRVAVRRAKEAIARGDRPADAYLTIGIVYYRQGYLDDALAALRQAIERDGRHAEALRWAALLYRQRGDLVNEYETAKRAYEAAPSDTYYIGHFGDVLVNRLGDLRQAKTVWGRAVNESPDNVFALQQLGRVEQFLGHYTRAVALLETAFRLDPSNAVTRWLLGYALLDAQRLDDAVRLFQEWVAQAPNDPTAHTNLGVVYGRARRGREAIAELEKAYQLGERSLDHYEYLCELYFYETTELQRSAQCFRQLLWWQPGRTRALQLLPEIEKNLGLATVRKR